LSSDADKKIAKCFAEVLSISDSTIGSNSNFFDLGGSSLHAFTLVNKISEALGVKLELKQFFDNASPGELAKLFDAQAAKQLTESSLDRYKKRPLTHYECIKLKEATEAPATNIFLVHGAFRNASGVQRCRIKVPRLRDSLQFPRLNSFGSPRNRRPSTPDQWKSSRIST
jgi:acyl carrier protein